jgi:AcrR family transcriptional regulator
MARGNPEKDQPGRRSSVTQRLANVVSDAIDEAADKVNRKVDAKRDQAQAKIDEKHRKVAEKLDQRRELVLSRLDRATYPDIPTPGPDSTVYDLWLRDRPGSRRPRFSYDEIAEAALRVVDAEGLDALSMRRLATELGAGTMTLYHYVQSKDELLALLIDRVMDELLIPDDEFPEGWREALTALAHRTRETMTRHLWFFDISVDPGAGPNGVRHFDQSLRALSTLDLPLEEKLDILGAIDEYTFGHCLHARGDTHAQESDAEWEAMVSYFTGLVEEGGFPQLSALVDEHGIEDLSERLRDYGRDARRFDRNLARILDGIERDLPRG